MDLFAGLPEPLARAWERSLTSGRAAHTRRRFLAASGALAAGAALTGCGIAGSGDGEKDTGDKAAAAKDYSAKEKKVVFSNWPLYIDVDDKDENRRPTLERFQQQTGIEVKYTEDINDNVEFFGKIKPQLAAGQDTGRDLMILTDWMAGRFIRAGWAQRLNPANLGNVVTNMEARFRNAAHDPGRQFTVPWTGLSTVIAYNKKTTGGKKIESVSQLLGDSSLKGKVSLLTEMRDTVGMTLLDMGKDCTKFTDDDYDAALAAVQKAVDSGQIRRFTGNDYTEELAKGDIGACLAWAGDIVQLQADNEDIEFVIPAKGYLYATDDMLIPAKARHQANAEALMNFYYDPKNAAELAAWVNYISPVAGAKEELARIDESLANDPLIIPDQAMIDGGHVFMDLDEAKASAYEDKFAKLIGA
ncbi:Spermidine-binding periplasmic protein SpuE [Streptomyces sp. RB5]|uniref:Spermidine-binding periplasmic protein SpuE n=1 Tax=Streptomyces smaragdinus TaxID=2585196 RepID=A0A7K0CRJ4_9ACTN|nr:spermidine/putrescine ABC transporter substrate-binding protein [Streptomyces smaragdinus]MQY15963.1 Spermidine-binding periplasmic protein SpuE [Streptomyces smaragdinus]